jgi:serine/threonine protein kinase
MSTPAEQMTGRDLPNGWSVTCLIPRTGSQTGGHFSCSYNVENVDGRKAFLKAMDYTRALTAPDPATALNAMTSAYLFERQLLEECKDKKMSRIVKAIENGKEMIAGAVVEYLIFEVADGDIRSYLDAATSFDLVWTISCIHNVCLGVQQLNMANIAHQDLKPSNVLVFAGDGEKLADLGRAWHKLRISPHDDMNFAGDLGYAPPELLYGYLSNEETERRFGADFYLLGSMILFLFTGLRASALLLAELSSMHHPRVWKGSYEEVLPYLQHAFTANLLTIQTSFTDQSLAEEVIDVFRQTCNPDIALRGDKYQKARHGSRFGVQRIISQFDRLRLAARLGKISHP